MTLGESDDDFAREQARIRGAPVGEYVEPPAAEAIPLGPTDAAPAADDAPMVPGDYPAATGSELAATSAVDLLAQVKGGNVTRPALEKAFGPSRQPAGAVSAGGDEWKGLATRLALARGRQHSARVSDDIYNGITSVLNPRARSNQAAAADTGVAEITDEMGLAKAKANSAAQAAALEQRRKAGEWGQFKDLAGMEQRKLEHSDRLRADADRIKGEQEQRAVDADRKEQEDAETRRHNLALEGKAKEPKAAKSAPPPSPVFTEGEVDKVPEDIRPQVKAIINLQAPAPTGTTKDPSQKLIRKYLYQVRPDFDEGAYARKQSGLTHIVNSKDTTALPVAIHHLDLAQKAIEDTPENVQFDSPTLNKMAQSVITGTGGEEFVGPAFGLKVAADEVAAVYGANTEAGREAIAKMFDPRGSKAQRLSVIREARKYIAGKLAGGQENIDRLDPTGSSHFSLITPSVRAALGESEHKAGPKEGDEKTTSNGKSWVYRGGGWVRK